MDLNDFFAFVFGNAVQDLDAAPDGGARFPVDARLAGRTFVKFYLDVSSGDVLREPYDSLPGRDWLGFAGIPSTDFAAVSPEEQFAEKLHAYTLPRVGRENTRVKDLVDLVLLIEQTELNTTRLPQAIRETFQRRKTHDIPRALISPPAFWSNPFAEMAVECGLERDMETQFGVVAQFFSSMDLLCRPAHAIMSASDSTYARLAEALAECERLREENRRSTVCTTASTQSSFTTMWMAVCRCSR